MSTTVGFGFIKAIVEEQKGYTEKRSKAENALPRTRKKRVKKG